MLRVLWLWLWLWLQQLQQLQRCYAQGDVMCYM
jgi:hypothetical protein